LEKKNIFTLKEAIGLGYSPPPDNEMKDAGM
jgi:hypothetical protein